MNRFAEYIIPFGACSNGLHLFEYELNDKFFALFPGSGIEKTWVGVKVTLLKQERQLQLDFHLKGTVNLPCDRCLEEYEQPVSGDFTLYGKFGEGNSEDEDDIIWLQPEAYEVNISKYLFEFVILSLPLRKVHPGRRGSKNGCNPEMLDLLKNLSV
jgi:uncharacterized metal-binding protein YceD (DUF177 family)